MVYSTSSQGGAAVLFYLCSDCRLPASASKFPFHTQYQNIEACINGVCLNSLFGILKNSMSFLLLNQKEPHLDHQLRKPRENSKKSVA